MLGEKEVHAAGRVQCGNGCNRQSADIDGYGLPRIEKHRGAAGAWLCDLRRVRNDRVDLVRRQRKTPCWEDRSDLQPGHDLASRAADECYRGRPGLRLRILRVAVDVSRMRIKTGRWNGKGLIRRKDA